MNSAHPLPKKAEQKRCISSNSNQRFIIFTAGKRDSVPMKMNIKKQRGLKSTAVVFFEGMTFVAAHDSSIGNCRSDVSPQRPPYSPHPKLT